MIRKNLYLAGVPLLATTLLAGCLHNDDDSNSVVSYEVTVTNLTEAQPLSPPALILHSRGYHIWQIGTAASDGLEQLAEGGTPDALLTEASAHPSVKAATADNAVILPGASSSVIIQSQQSSDLALSMATMLVNTNDGFTGMKAEPLYTLAQRERRNLTVTAYDAGTEANSETASTVPGPAAGGKGYNSARDDSNSVGGHPGVISSDDGLSGSALNASHRFDNPVALITITRLR